MIPKITITVLLYFLFDGLSPKILLRSAEAIYFPDQQNDDVSNQPQRFRVGIVTMELPISIKRDFRARLGVAGFTPKAAAKVVGQLTQYFNNYERFLTDLNIEAFPVLLTESQRTIREKMRNLDGLLLIGGAPGITEPAFQEGSLDIIISQRSTKRYFKVIAKIMAYAKQINVSRRPFVVYGICMGFEAMLLNEVNFSLPLTKIGKQNVNDKIFLTFNGHSFLDYIKSSSPNEILNSLDRGLVYFNNEKGISVQNFLTNRRLNSEYEVLGYYKASLYGREDNFVGMVQHRHYPFFAIQFHPEKNLYETSENFKADHSDTSIRAAKVFQHYISFILERVGDKRRAFENNFDFMKDIGSFPIEEIGVFKGVKIFGPNDVIGVATSILN